jgi:flagellar hook-basal body complex protein FliE
MTLGLMTATVQAITPVGHNVADVTANRPAHSNFSELFETSLQRVNQKLTLADAKVQALAVGENVALHDVMISMEDARLSFQLAVQVRNRLLEAYQDVMRMQL